MGSLEWEKIDRKHKRCAPALIRKDFVVGGGASPFVGVSLSAQSARSFESLRATLERSSWWQSTRQALEEALSPTPRAPVVATNGHKTLDDSNTDLCGLPGDLSTVEWLLCFGLGRPSESLPSAIQLAAASLFQQRWSIPADRTWISDPAMTDDDYNLLEVVGKAKSYDKSFVGEAKEGGRSRSAVHFPAAFNQRSLPKGKKVLIFMPHCDAHVYGGLLHRVTETLGRSALQQCVLLGNDLSQYDISGPTFFNREVPNSNSSPEIALLQSLLPFAKGCSLDELAKAGRSDDAFFMAFNDLAVTTFLTDSNEAN